MISRLLSLFALDFSPDPAGDPAVYRPLRRNWLLYAGAISVWFTGASFFASNTVLPVFAYRLTGSTFIVSLVPALIDAGVYLPSLIIAPLVERRERVKPMTLWLGGIQRMCYLALALSVVWLAGLERNTAQWIFIGLVAAIAIANGFPSSAGTEIQARMMPISRRGRLLGTALVIGQIFGIGGAQLAALILAWLPFPQNFALGFLVGAVLLWISIISNVFYREPSVKPRPRRTERFAYLGRLAQILRQNPNFRLFLISRAFAYLGGMAIGFIAVYGVERFGLPDSSSAVFAAILAGASMIGYGVWGAVGDRRGYKKVLAFSMPLWLVALILLLLAPGTWVFYVAFALFGLYTTAALLTDINMSIEFGPESERPTYFGLSRTVTAPALLIAPIIGGWLAEAWGFRPMFAISFALAALSLVILLFKVRDPRDLALPQSTLGSELQSLEN